MTETIREIIETAEGLGDLPAATCLLRQWEDGNLIPTDEHLDCVADARTESKAEGASLANRVLNKICAERVATAGRRGMDDAHALLGEWLAIPVENDAYKEDDMADLRTRTRELLDRGA